MSQMRAPPPPPSPPLPPCPPPPLYDPPPPTRAKDSAASAMHKMKAQLITEARLNSRIARLVRFAGSITIRNAARREVRLDFQRWPAGTAPAAGPASPNRPLEFQDVAACPLDVIRKAPGSIRAPGGL